MFNVISKYRGSEKLGYYIEEAALELRDLLMPTIDVAPKL